MAACSASPLLETTAPLVQPAHAHLDAPAQRRPDVGIVEQSAHGRRQAQLDAAHVGRVAPSAMLHRANLGAELE
jgi:hypothetical protein